MDSTVIAIDVAKDVFEIGISHQPGQVTERLRLSRAKFETWFAQRTPATVIFEACGMAHHWGRYLSRLGHHIRLIPPQIVRCYVHGNKTDRTDVKAMLECYRNEDIHCVPVKSEAQQGIMSLHRLRSGWMTTRTARINEVRGLLREFGVVIPVGASRFLERASAAIHKQDTPLPLPMKAALEAALAELAELATRIDAMDKSLAQIARSTPKAKDLQTIPGVGVLTATAAVGSLVELNRFKSARQLASALGLTPRESSTGNRRWLGRITKRGDPYLRTLLIHGARSLIRAAKAKARPDKLEAWALDRESKIGHNKASVAVANKLARIVWAVWVRGIPYQSRFV